MKKLYELKDKTKVLIALLIFALVFIIMLFGLTQEGSSMLGLRILSGLQGF